MHEILDQWHDLALISGDGGSAGRTSKDERQGSSIAGHKHQANLRGTRSEVPDRNATLTKPALAGCN